MILKRIDWVIKERAELLGMPIMKVFQEAGFTDAYSGVISNDELLKIMIVLGLKPEDFLSEDYHVLYADNKTTFINDSEENKPWLNERNIDILPALFHISDELDEILKILRGADQNDCNPL